MNVRNIIEFLIGSMFLSTFFIISGKKFFDQKLNKSFKTILVIISLIVFITVNYMILDNIAKMITLYVFVLFVYKLLFKKNIAQCAIGTLISYFLLVVCEILFTVIIIALHEMNVVENIEIYAGSVLANFCITSIAILMSLLISKVVNKGINKVKENYKFTLIFTFSIVLMAISSVFYKMYYSNWLLNYALILNVIIILSLVFLGLLIIKQHIDKIKIGDDYEKYVEYSKQSEKLVEQYSISQHENKNELIIIKSMVYKNNKKLLEYLEEIISNKDNIENAWIRFLRYLPFGGLKGIIHNKISVMKEANINVFLNISKDVEKSKLKSLTIKENNQLSKIIGVFLDNAMEASVSSKDKEVSICIYMEEDVVVFEIANSYDDDVSIKNIYEAGYSSKGKHRGYGLALVKTIIDENKIFENETNAVNNYFIQVLRVKK